MKLVTSEDAFWTSCPCAGAIVRYATQLPELRNRYWSFSKALVRPERTTALFKCEGLAEDEAEVWIDAIANGSGSWALQHSPVTS